MKMKGFWPSQDDFPTDLPTMNLSREDTTEAFSFVLAQAECI